MFRADRIRRDLAPEIPLAFRTKPSSFFAKSSFSTFVHIRIKILPVSDRQVDLNGVYIKLFNMSTLNRKNWGKFTKIRFNLKDISWCGVDELMG